MHAVQGRYILTGEAEHQPRRVCKSVLHIVHKISEVICAVNVAENTLGTRIGFNIAVFLDGGDPVVAVVCQVNDIVPFAVFNIVINMSAAIALGGGDIPDFVVISIQQVTQPRGFSSRSFSVIKSILYCFPKSDLIRLFLHGAHRRARGSAGSGKILFDCFLSLKAVHPKGSMIILYSRI